MLLEVGTKAPDFTLPDKDGNLVSLADFAGKKVVLYFYPKDNTAGCTKQAQGFSDLYDEFAAKNTVVIGMNRNSAQSHRKFIDKYALKQTLIADESGETVDAYGVWQQKTMAGRKYMGIVRSTYIIDENGVITHAFYNVKGATNPADMLQLV